MDHANIEKVGIDNFLFSLNFQISTKISLDIFGVIQKNKFLRGMFEFFWIDKLTATDSWKDRGKRGKVKTNKTSFKRTDQKETFGQLVN